MKVEKKEPEKLNITFCDSLALMLLRDFITLGYPSIDPRTQVDAAYQYAELMCERKEKI
jgi:hypothetical protein